MRKNKTTMDRAKPNKQQTKPECWDEGRCKQAVVEQRWGLFVTWAAGAHAS